MSSSHRDDHDCAAPVNGAIIWASLAFGVVGGFVLFYVVIWRML